MDGKSSLHAAPATSKATLTEHSRSNGTRLMARKTPRSRLIASLLRTRRTPQGTPSSESPKLASSVDDKSLLGDETNTGSQFAVVGFSESSTFNPELTEASHNHKALSTHVTGVMTQEQKTPFLTKVSKPVDPKNTRHRARKFDSMRFDVAIYGQPGAMMKPPLGMSLPFHRHQRPTAVPKESGRMYIYADPAIHLCHNRSDEWHKLKAREIQTRGRRKTWFGQVAARLRWIRVQEADRKTQLMGDASSHRLVTPQPWTYRRPLDFGVVKESNLPGQVLQNADWQRACAWHREVRLTKTLCRRLAPRWALRRAQEETQQYYANVVESIRTGRA